jgi:activating signal cointegrator complex subunit 3
MIGRAGRPQFNDKGVACVFVEKDKKSFYRKYLNDPFPIESSLRDQLPDHINAEVAVGTILNKQMCMEYLTWTYYFRRIMRNPLFYNLETNDTKSIQKFLIELIDSVCMELKDSGCLTIDDNNFALTSTFSGHITSTYYLKHQSVKKLYTSIHANMPIYSLI